MSHLHFVGIGGIGISALARYYKWLGYTISGSSDADSDLIHTLLGEWMDIRIGHASENVPADTERVIYTEAILGSYADREEGFMANPELRRSREMGIAALSYPEALAEVVNVKKCIAITGSHGKSTTTAMTGIMLAGSTVGASVLVGTQVPQFGGSNLHFEQSEYFAIEACEYKRSFLRYRPYVTVITNIDLDHLDYYRDLEDYIWAFQSIVDQTSGFVVLDGNDPNSACLRIPDGIGAYRVYGNEYTDPSGARHAFPAMTLQVPGDHLAYDARLAFLVGRIVGLEEDYAVGKLESYSGSWRRSEIIRTTENGNILMSDYGHHPTEIRLTLAAIRARYPDKRLFVAFQPHQYSRTIELLDGFMTAFDAADELLIPDIYFSRDSEENVKAMPVSRLIETLATRYPQAQGGLGLEVALQTIRMYDRMHAGDSIILLLGAGNLDDLRHDIV